MQRGRFTTDEEKSEERCIKCNAEEVYYKLWESYDGAHEDYKFRCSKCGEVWWAEGPDA